MTSNPNTRLRQAARVWQIALNGLLAALVLLFVADRAAQAVKKPHKYWLEQVRHQPYYESQSWTAQYIADLDEAKPDSRIYAPYVLWRRQELRTETVNIDADGRRIVPGAQCGPGAKRIFLFGASVLWGIGAPDGLTIPALLQTELAKSVKGALCVVNMADVGWTSTQSVIALMLELQKGNRPDVVIFMQGMTDLLAALENKDPYLHFTYQKIAGRLNDQTPLRDAWVYLYPFVSTLLGIRKHGSPPGHRDPELYEQTAQVLAENLHVVRALSTRYGFRFRAYMPPDPYFAKKSYTPDETAVADIMAGRLQLNVEQYRKMLRGLSPSLSLMDDVFVGETRQLFIDYEHVNPIGNELIARSLAKDLLPLLGASR
jgi:lysophospholipase L1-like esterase